MDPKYSNMPGSILSYQQKTPVKLLCEIDLKKLFPASAPKERERFDKKWNDFLKSDPCNKEIFELKESEKSNPREYFILWYKRQIKKQLKIRIPRYDKRIGVEANDFRISDLGHRWASCGRNGVISFNWRSIMAPIWVFDYILVHEMVHLIERRHSKRFWGLVSRVIPDYEEHALWLNENGADMDL
jgi:predicted metal-dependent hydrolase